MGRVHIGVALAGAALLAACNALSGADGLSVGPAGVDEAEIGVPTTSKSDASTGEPSRPHDTATTDAGSPPPDLDSGGIDAASEAAAQLPTFLDTFSRADGTPIGNGWVEKSPGKFALVNGAVQQKQTGIYRNLFVSRPAFENVTDVLLQTTVTFSASTADPCLFARIQPGSEVTNTFYGYSVYADGPADLYVSRDDGSAFTDMGSSIISPGLTVGRSYRLSLQVTGTNPVHLVGSIAALDGTVLATITANDGSNKRISSAGSVGFGSSAALNGRWDDFKRVTLAP